MPRFLTTICDVATNEIATNITTNTSPISAILQHPWIQETYRDSYITNVLRKETEEETVQNIYDCLGWSALCENLDEKIMAVMNGSSGGDGSVSFNQPTE